MMQSRQNRRSIGEAAAPVPYTAPSTSFGSRPHSRSKNSLLVTSKTCATRSRILSGRSANILPAGAHRLCSRRVFPTVRPLFLEEPGRAEALHVNSRRISGSYRGRAARGMTPSNGRYAMPVELREITIHATRPHDPVGYVQFFAGDGADLEQSKQWITG